MQVEVEVGHHQMEAALRHQEGMALLASLEVGEASVGPEEVEQAA